MDALVSHAETFLDWRASAPLATLDDAAIRAFLLDWCPRQLTLAAEESGAVCEAVAELVCFLGSTQRLRGGTKLARELMRTAVGLEPAKRAAMADPANYGMTKSLFASIEGAESMTQDQLGAAMQQRVNEHNALPLEQRKALTDKLFKHSPRTIELPFPYIPPPLAEVATAAAEQCSPRRCRRYVTTSARRVRNSRRRAS